MCFCVFVAVQLRSTGIEHGVMRSSPGLGFVLPLSRRVIAACRSNVHGHCAIDHGEVLRVLVLLSKDLSVARVA